MTNPLNGSSPMGTLEIGPQATSLGNRSGSCTRASSTSFDTSGAMPQLFRLGTLVLFSSVVAFGLSGCNLFSRLSNVGDLPAVSALSNPTHNPSYKPVSMPMPVQQASARPSTSLWREGSKAFFKDLRANQVGDILTVLINTNDSASLENQSTAARTNTEQSALNNLFGLEGADHLGSILPDGAVPASLVNYNTSRSIGGTGNIQRREEIELRVSAVITQILPNGNLVIHGRQETRVNFEIRELQIAGVVRPTDITATNTISYEKIAEARLSYGGRGHISDVQQPRFGSQIVDIILPF